MKGQLEEAVRALAFSKLLIFRPPVLVRPNSDRAGEVWSVRILRWLNRMGLFAAERPMPTRVLAQALVQAIETEGEGTFVFESSAIWDMWQQAEKAGVHGAHAASTAKRA